MTDRDKYLNLLADTLTFSLWPEPPRPFSMTASRWLWPLRFASKQLKRVGLDICHYAQVDRMEGGSTWPSLAHTMVGRKRLENIRTLCETVQRENVPGDFVECGVWRGGASIFARACLDYSRWVVCCDSFQGFPADSLDPQYKSFGHLAVSAEEVRGNFVRFGQLRNVEFHKGWFSDTLPKLAQLNRPIAILRADGDMTLSTLQILTNLYPLVPVGGFVIIDDFGLPECQRALRHFFHLKPTQPEFVHIDKYSAFWRKS